MNLKHLVLLPLSLYLHLLFPNCREVLKNCLNLVCVSSKSLSLNSLPLLLLSALMSFSMLPFRFSSCFHFFMSFVNSSFLVLLANLVSFSFVVASTLMSFSLLLFLTLAVFLESLSFDNIITAVLSLAPDCRFHFDVVC